MTTNIAESLNGILVDARELPIIALVEHLRGLLQRYFYDRHNVAINLTTTLTLWVEQFLEERNSKSSSMCPTAIDQNQFIVRDETKDGIVNLHNKTCTCREFDLDQISCAYAIAAVRERHIRAFYPKICILPNFPTLLPRGVTCPYLPISSIFFFGVPSAVLACPISLFLVAPQFPSVSSFVSFDREQQSCEWWFTERKGTQSLKKLLQKRVPATPAALPHKRAMNVLAPHEEEDDHGEVFLDESDIIQEVEVDEEDLPDAVDEDGSDGEFADEADDSIHTFTGHTGEVYTVACSPTDATLVATGGGDDKGFIWKIGRGDFAQELTGHKDSVSSLAFSADGQLLASGSFDGLVQIWDISSGHLKCVLEGPGGGIEWVRWHPRGHLVLAGSEDSTAWMWNADRGVYLNMFSGHGASVTCGDFTPDGKTICTGSDDATMRIWNPRSGENIHVVRGHPYHTEGLTSLALSSDSTLAVSGSKDGSVHIVNIATGKVVNSLIAHSDSIECIGLAPSSPWAATGGMDQKLIIWDLRQSVARSTCNHEDGVTCLTWIGTSRYLATGCVDGRVRIWDSLSGDCIRTFTGHSDAIQSLCVSANHDYLVSVALDNTARVFEIAEYH